MDIKKIQIFNIMWNKTATFWREVGSYLNADISHHLFSELLRCLSLVCRLIPHYLPFKCWEFFRILHRTSSSHQSLPHNHCYSVGSKWGVSMKPKYFPPVFSGLGLYIWLFYCYCWRDAQILKFRMSLTELMIYMLPTCCQASLSVLHATLFPPFSLSPLITLQSQPQTH